MKQTGYDSSETDFLVQGFKKGFTIGYKGAGNRTDTSENIPITPGVGSKHEMWDKVMKEAEMGRIAGPFREIPFLDTFIQSPIGLVPKAGNKTRLIFHLSYNFANGNKSVNHWTSEEECAVKYDDLDHAVRLILKLQKKGNANISNVIFFGKSDLKSAFRILPILPGHRRFLILKAQNPMTGEYFYFLDKNLPFGGSIACSHFTCFSNSLRHIVENITGKKGQITSYLDDFLFISKSREECNFMVSKFLRICEYIGFPVSDDKTEWATEKILFLGILLDGITATLAVPLDKKERALRMLQGLLNRKKATVKELERLSGFLNFLTKAIVPRRVFTHRMYSKFTGDVLITKSGMKLKHYHQVKIDAEFRRDCDMWVKFLQCQEAVNRPFIDLSNDRQATILDLYSDASASVKRGF